MNSPVASEFQLKMDRRTFLGQSAVATWLAMTSTSRAAESKPNRLFFTSQGKTALTNADGSDLKYLAFEAPNQATWQPSGCFSDGRHVCVLSMEPRRDGPGKPFDEYYTQTPTHLWRYDLKSGSLEEICQKDRIAPFTTPALIINDDRLLVQVVKNKVGQIYSVRVDGTDAKEFTKAGEGLPYGLSLSPDGKRVAYHLASPQGYQVWTSNTDGGNRVKLAAAPEHLYFGTQWSPDGQWVLYVDCHYQKDHGHDWADVCIGRADGSEHRVLTEGQSMWFAATYGSPKTRGSGSNVPSWTKDGLILFPQRTKGAIVPWQYRTGKPDLDHFNRDFKPEESVGSAQICTLDPKTGTIKKLTPERSGVWDFRASQSPDGKQIAFCRAETGNISTLWVMDSDGQNAKMITKGIDELGADHPRWLPTLAD